MKGISIWIVFNTESVSLYHRVTKGGRKTRGGWRQNWGKKLVTEKSSEAKFSRRWEGSTRSNHGESLSWGAVCGVGSVMVSGGRGWANVEGHPVKAGNPSLPPPLPRNTPSRCWNCSPPSGTQSCTLQASDSSTTSRCLTLCIHSCDG